MRGDFDEDELDENNEQDLGASLLRADELASPPTTEALPDKEQWDWGDWTPCSQHPKADHELVCFECNPALKGEPDATHDIGDEKRAAIYRRLQQDFQMVAGLSDAQLHHLSLIGAATVRELLWQLSSLESMLAKDVTT
jgi:hypothetical protein